MEENYIKCPICGKEVRRLKFHFYRSKEHQGLDYKKYLSEHPEIETLSTSERDKYCIQNKISATPEKMSMMANKFWSNPEIKERRLKAIKDQHDSKEFKELHREVGRRTMSKLMSNEDFFWTTVENTKDTSLGKVSTYTTRNGNVLKLRSSIELSIAEYLDKMNLNFEYETKVIPYEKNGNPRRYLIDFILPDYNIGIEAKPKKLWNDEDTVLKINAAKKYFDKVILVGYDLSELKLIIESVTTNESITNKKSISEEVSSVGTK